MILSASQDAEFGIFLCLHFMSLVQLSATLSTLIMSLKMVLKQPDVVVCREYELHSLLVVHLARGSRWVL